MADLDELINPPCLFRKILNIWAEAAESIIDQSKDEYMVREAELHALKRITPGRKIKYNSTNETAALQDEAIRQANRLPTVPNPSIPPRFTRIWNDQVNCHWEQNAQGEYWRSE